MRTLELQDTDVALGAAQAPSLLQAQSLHQAQPLHAARSAIKAQVSAVEWPPASGRRAVCKDMSRCPLWYRLVAGRRMLDREWNTLQRLAALPAVAGPLERPHADCIVMEYCAGVPLMALGRGVVPNEVPARLLEIVTLMHEMGVTHGDLHRSNILLEPNGAIHIIDWATSCTLGEQPGPLRQRWFRELCALDLRAVYKLKALYTPHLVNDHERDVLLNGTTATYRFVKRLRYLLDRLRGRLRPDDIERKRARYEGPGQAKAENRP